METNEIAREVFEAMKKEIAQRLEVATDRQIVDIYNLVCAYIRI